VTNIDQQKSTLAGAFAYGASSPGFQRGDVDGATGVNQTDAISILLYLFRGGDITCLDAADVNDDGKLNVSDAIRLLFFLFQGGAPPAEPFETRGPDPTEDTLGCGKG
jgi:hypothetical protein